MINKNETSSSEAKKSKKTFSFSNLVYNDKYLIILSVVVAVLVWIFASLSVGTDETKTIKVDVPIKLGDSVSEQLGMQYYSLQDTVELTVSVTGAKYVVGQVTENDLDISFDTSAVNRVGDHTIPIIVNNKSKSLDFTVDSVYPKTIDGYFDVNSEKTFDVVLNYDSTNVAQGYAFGNPVLNEDKVVVSGPKTYIEKITEVYCDIDFGDKADLTETFTQDCEIRFNGDSIVNNFLTVTSRTDKEKPIKNINVTLPVLKKVVLPVTSSFEDKPQGLPDGIVSVSYSVNNVGAGVLPSADIASANIGKIYFNSLTVGTQSFDFSTDALNGITVLDGTKTITATVTVSSHYTEQTVNISRDKVVIEGAPEGSDLSVSYLDDATVTVLAPKGTTLTASDLIVKCDVSKTAADNKYPLSVTVTNNECWVYGKYSAVVK